MRGLIEEMELVGYNPSEGQFEPFAKYHKSMDFLLYLNTDCAYRADRVDIFLTVLWHPNEQRIVGLKLKGFKFLFGRLMAISGTQIKESGFIQLVEVLEIAMVGGVAESMMRKIETGRLQQRYEEARRFARDGELRVPSEEYLPLAA